MRCPKRLRTCLIVAGFALSTGCTPTPEDVRARDVRAANDAGRMAEALSGRIAGKPVHCIDQRRIRSTRSYGDVLLYRMDGGVIYRNDPVGGCGDTSRGALITRTPSSRLCSGDIAELRDLRNGISYGSCAFGAFTPYKEAR